MNVIRPQEGFQMNFLSTSADIAIGGSGAGVGKTFSLLLEPLRHSDNRDFGTVLFRRTTPQIKAEGGVWDATKKIYNLVDGASAREHTTEWIFKSGSKLKCSHLEHEKNIYDWQGAEIPLILFDELTHFTKKMFFYLLTRNRSTCGVKPYVRATCNPDADSWVLDLIEWWINEEGYPIPEREGALRYFIVDRDSYIMGDSYEDVYQQSKHILDPLMEGSGYPKEAFIKSLTFISGSIFDNKKLLETDPNYLGNLNAQDEDTKNALLKGNWKVKITPEELYKVNNFGNCFDAPYSLKNGVKRITADIAMEGSDKFVVFVWDGMEIIDCSIMDKSNGRQVLDVIQDFQRKYTINSGNVIFDNDGVGTFLGGFIPQGIPFVNGSKAMGAEKYEHLKAQCYYKSSDRFNNGEVRINESVYNKMYNDKQTIRQRLNFERKAIRKIVDSERVLRINKKVDQKVILRGDSPDLMDAIMMFELFFLGQQI